MADLHAVPRGMYDGPVFDLTTTPKGAPQLALLEALPLGQTHQ